MFNKSLQSVSDIFQCDGNITVESISPDEYFPIKPIVTFGRPDQYSFVKNHIKYKRNLITVKRSNKVLEASNLPVVLNLNPRSLYNKQEEFCTLVEQTDAGLCCISETWDRSHVRGGTAISDLINIDGYRWIKNVVQRKRKGGKPAILASERDYYIKELCPDIITVPINVEAVWILLTPKHRSVNSRAQS